MLASAKRTKAEKQSIHAWHTYYAGYSEAFVKSAAKYLEIEDNSITLDPWAGSGTTNFVLSKVGFNSIGVELNPVMAAHADAKSRENSEIDLLLAEDLIKSYLFLSKDWQESIRNAIRNNYLSFETGFSEKNISFIKSSLFSTLRRTFKISSGSNPSWHKSTDFDSSKTCRDTFFADWKNVSKRMRADLRKEFHTTQHKGEYEIITGDTTSLPVQENSIDYIITSPPYLTRIDYAISTKPELIFFYGEDELREIRKRMMGTTMIVPPKQEKHCNAVSDLLDTIRNHHTVASGGYYYKNISQYFDMASRSLRGVVNSLRPGGKGLIVVQTSYYKEVPINLGHLYCEIAEQAGAKAKIIKQEMIKRNMSTVNTASSNYIKEKKYHEQIVEITKE